MSRFMCIIQESSDADHHRGELERGLQSAHSSHYPGESTSVSWMAVPPGFMFTEGQPSTSSIVSCSIDHETTLDLRTSYMRAVCDLWTETTGCTDHEVVVTISENTEPASAGPKE